MKKLFIIICALFIGVASADNVITSKEYVDTAGATLQPQVQAKNTNTVLTYPAAGTDTPGEKAIYDASSAYDEQTDSLVTAGQFNTALQNALDTEFVCVSRNDQGCLLYEIRTTYHKSKNLANFDDAAYNDPYWHFDRNTGTLYGTGSDTNFSFFLRNVKAGERFTISANFLDIVNKANIHLRSYDDPRLILEVSPLMELGFNSWTFTIPDDGNYRVNIRCNGTNSSLIVNNIQIEEGSVATPYVPYGNIYMPSAE